MRKDTPLTTLKTGHSTGEQASPLSPLARISRSGAAMFAAAMLVLAPAAAQDVESFDPDEAFETTAQGSGGGSGAIDADLADPSLREAPQTAEPLQTEEQAGFEGEFADYSDGDVATAQEGEPVPEWTDPVPGEQVAGAQEANSGTFAEDDLIGAAEGVFGKGAQGLAGMIEDLLRKQGEPNGYIVGREAGGAFIFGARYGSGTLHHKVEGQRKVYWTGPSLGFDAGANAGNTFVLVYNLYDTQDIFRRYPAGEGQAYFVGGLHASYMRRGDVVLIPIRIGAGLRLGVNAGYMRFSEKQRWLPF
ncbi:hypothetical protein NAP1_15583 [Erythrobacter sp. NAP1]|uniref:DUF1134 domain-containing protein n=1 Tax=Erythrobacter sp. NAP1 TaxID=237727 RepID=UPI0000687768|nr:hypothetical protein NAP1_15583 [Erythrobacter sp. NAP1]